MASGFENGSAKAERLSALADGEVDSAAAADACGAWKADGELRRSWHAWHLIGDVLRYEDLASSAEGDQAFRFALRARIDNVTDENNWISAGGFPGQGYLVLGAPLTFVLSASIDF